jgi:hypothetical protein
MFLAVEFPFVVIHAGVDKIHNTPFEKLSTSLQTLNYFKVLNAYKQLLLAIPC